MGSNITISDKNQHQTEDDVSMNSEDQKSIIKTTYQSC